MRRLTFVNTVAAGGLLLSALPMAAFAAASDLSFAPSVVRGTVEQQIIMSTPAVIPTIQPKISTLVPETIITPVDKSYPLKDLLPTPMQQTFIIDDGDKGFSYTGQWQVFPLAGYRGDFLYASTQNGNRDISKAAWNFSGLQAVTHDVYVTWDAYAGLTDSAVYSISGIFNASAIINQRNAPADMHLENRGWKKIGTMKPNGKGQLTVTLASNVPSGFVIADAALLIPEKATNKRQLGDVDNNGVAGTPTDTFLVIQHVLGIKPLSSADVPYADVDQDGAVTRADIYLLSGNGARSLLTPYPRVYGDVTGDQFVRSGDVTVVQRYIKGIEIPTNVQKYLADVNVDNRIDSKDVTLLQEYIVGTIPELPVLCGNGIVNSEPYNGEQCDDNNRVSGDGCSAMCTIESAPAPKLSITEKNIASNNSAVSSQKNVQLLAFEARSSLEDILMTSAVFKASDGNAQNAHSYALWVDTDNNGSVDTILQGNVAAQKGLISFQNIIGGGYVIPGEKTVSFEVRADIASSLISSTLKLAFADGAVVSAQALKDGRSADVTINRTGGSTLYTLRTSGDLYITKSTTPVRSRQLLGGTLADEVMRLDLRAEHEDIDVTQLVFTADGIDAASFSSNVDRLELFKVGETTPFAIASVAGCGSSTVPANSMCANMQAQQLVVTKGSNTNVLVRPRMRTDSNGAVSGRRIKLKVDAAVGGQARGLFSSNNLLQNDNDSSSEGELFIGTSTPAASVAIVGNDNVVVLSKVTSITNADPNANGTAVPTGVGPIARFKFSTAASSNFQNGTNRVTFDGIIFNINATNVDMNGGAFKFYNLADAVTKAPCSIIQQSGLSSLLVACQDLRSTSVNTEIDPGSDAIFVLEADIQNPQVSNVSTSVVQVSLQNFTDIAASSFSAAGSHMNWSDKDISAATSFLWIEYPETQINGTVYQD